MDRVDIIVIGAGPAGMTAAATAASRGASVLVLEKTARCGMKILITGKGRCNVTNIEPDLKKFATNYGKNGRSFLTALYAFDNQKVIDFFEQRGLKLQTERGGRVFPDGGDARDVNRIMQAHVAESGARLITNCKVEGFNFVDGRVDSVSTSQGELRAHRFILTTGGLSYPKTGGTGDGYAWARESGHRVIKPEPALVPVTLKESWTGQVNRFNLKNVRITLHLDNKKIDERFGEAFFTRKGIGGPIILDMSKAIRDALKVGKTTLVLDLKPAVQGKKFDRRLQRVFEENQNRAFKNSLTRLLPHDMIPLFITLSGIDPDKRCHSITKSERQTLLKLFKELELNVNGYEGFNKAIVTSGGVSLKDIDMRTMRSRKVDNLFFAGEIIDLDGRTGGFNLQVCWSTGYLAGFNASEGPVR